MPAAFTRAALTSISFLTKASNPAGVIGIGSPPAFAASLAFTAGTCSALTVSALSLSMMAFGVAAGANRPTQKL